MIEVEDLWKSYGPFVALRGISFQVPTGTIAGFLGPNGAGKSTTLKILTSFLPVGRGTARVAGHDVSRDPRAVCECTGYMPEQIALYPEMRVREYLRFRGTLRVIPRRQLAGRVDAVIEECRLEEVARKLLGALSRGYRQRVGLADVLLHEPEVLMLDEPTVGLDPLQVIEVRKLIKGFRGRRTVLLSSHMLGEVEQVCDQVIIIQHGEIRLQESRAGWQQRLRETSGLRLLLEDPPKDAAERLRELDAIEEIEQHGGVFTLRTRGDLRLEVSQLASSRRWKLLELTPLEANLESLFLAATEREPGTGP